tara:strand:+ start:488 stop:685 length:198 start_codon:yes stop_codon:yes gene_type:complete
MNSITNYGHTTPKTQWYDNHENLELLVRYLIEDDSDFTLENVLPILEKPWHWEWEFEQAQEKWKK